MKEPKRKPDPLAKLKPKSKLKSPQKDRSAMESTHGRTKRGKAISKGKS